MLRDVLNEVSADSGIQADQKRTLLLQILNKAAKEMHKELECNKIYRETTLVVAPDKLVSLPSFIGELRGTRMHTLDMPFDLNSIGSPRYVSNTLGYKFKNWRDLGESPVALLPSQIGQLTIKCDFIENPPCTILISGQTNSALQIEESIVLNATLKLTQNQFGPQIYSIASTNKNRIYDIHILDTDANEIAILYNSFSKTRYKIIDVSQVFWSYDTTDQQTLIDVMYKVQPYLLSRDSDSFYAGEDFDEAWYNMSMHFFTKPIQNRMQDSLAYRAAALDFLQSAKESGDAGMVKKMSFGRNRYYGQFKRYNWYNGGYYDINSDLNSNGY